MPHNTPVNGTIAAGPAYFDIRIERVFAHGAGRIWDALTKPEMLAKWLAPGKIELCKGGAARLDFGASGAVIDSTVTEIHPPHVIAYSWSAPGEPLRPLRFETKIVPGGTRLTVTLQIPLSEYAPRAAAGFETHLDMLAAALEDVPISFPFGQFKTLCSAYHARLPQAS